MHTHSFLALGGHLRGLAADIPSAPPSWEKWAAWLGKFLLLAGLGALSVGKELFRGREDSPLFLWAACGVLLLFLATVAFSPGRCSAAAGMAGPSPPGARCWRRPWCRPLPQLFSLDLPAGGGGGFLQGHLGWVIGQDGYLPFYLKNVGLVAVLAIGPLAAKGREFSL